MIAGASATLSTSVVFSHCVWRQEHCCSGPSIVPFGYCRLLTIVHVKMITDSKDGNTTTWEHAGYR